MDGARTIQNTSVRLTSDVIGIGHTYKTLLDFDAL